MDPLRYHYLMNYFTKFDNPVSASTFDKFFSFFDKMRLPVNLQVASHYLVLSAKKKADDCVQCPRPVLVIGTY